ncbi:hypothetical protein BKA65DRAFT_555248 [Rhexocercosporidium sp. MPI-PUGE-AT-0058]|nr:hypothetical protein BKA65DRAFT_555248 [Rhexocercosporidium sp. MPI-PUGE-AT-0058]
MSPKKTINSQKSPKGSPKAWPKSPLRKATRTSPRKVTKVTTSVTPKAIIKKTSRKNEILKLDKIPPKGYIKQNTKTSDALLTLKEDDESSEQDVVEKDPPSKAVSASIFDPVAKKKKEVRLFGQVLEPQQFKLGQIISVASHEEVYQDPKNRIKLEATQEQTLTALGWVYSKNRKIVVISRFAQHLVGLPIFSHGGKGLKKKEKSEFVGIRDSQYFRGTHTDSTYPNLTSHRIFPFAPANKTHWAVINGDSYVHFTRPLSFAYNTRCTIEGRLKDEDILRLINLTNSRRPTNPADPAARAAPR